MVLVSLLGAGLSSIIVAVALTAAPALHRLIRSLVLQTLSFDYIDAARALGASHVRILRRHIVPNILGRSIITPHSWAAMRSRSGRRESNGHGLR